jgi:uncharacterized integral membrane protein
MTEMRSRWWIIMIVGLLTFAVGCMILAAYVGAILQRGEWKYPELIVPICGSAVAGALAVGGAAFIHIRRSGRDAFIRSSALLMVACLAVSAGLFFALFANCSLSCSNRVVAESKSPDGQWTAVWSLETCTASARYCPSISRVVVVGSGDHVPRRYSEAFSATSSDGVLLQWKTNHLLVISYPAETRILLKQTQVGTVRLEYMPIGWM